MGRLTLAVRTNDILTIATLLREGYDVNEKDYDGTALMLAVERNQLALAELLLDHGADPNATGFGGKTALHATIRNDAREEHLDVVRLLLARGAKVDAADDAGNYPIHRAAADGHTSTVEFMLDHGADVNRKTVSHGRWDLPTTPLWYAVEKGHTETAALLESRGGQIPDDLPTGGGTTNRHTCKKCGREFPWSQGNPQQLTRVEQLVCAKENLPFLLMKKITCPHCATQSLAPEPGLSSFPAPSDVEPTPDLDQRPRDTARTKQMCTCGHAMESSYDPVAMKFKDAPCPACGKVVVYKSRDHCQNCGADVLPGTYKRTGGFCIRCSAKRSTQLLQCDCPDCGTKIQVPPNAAGRFGCRCPNCHVSFNVEIE